jgi:putative PIN family toxin of toxin-antitoxin system
VIVAVLDTDVLASGFAGLIEPESTPGDLLRRWRSGEFTLVVSEPILVELDRVFGYAYFTRRLSAVETAAAVAGLRREALIQPVTVHDVGAATHPADDLILATAVNAQAQYLVTGDKPLQALGTHRGITVLSPRQFLEVLEHS